VKILSVDDSSTMRKIIGRSVAMLGYELMEASNGEEALALLAQRHQEIAMVVLDINMPGMDGMATLQAIKTDPRYKDLPVMMVTTESERTRIIEAVRLGAANYVTKPFSPDDLATRMADTLGADLF